MKENYCDKKKIYVMPCMEMCEVEADIVMTSDSGEKVYDNTINVGVGNDEGVFDADVKSNRIVNFGEEDGWEE